MGSGGVQLSMRIRWFVYLSHALSTWGDRMWAFGVGIFMVVVSPESLRVTALYGLSMSIAVLLFGALVGDWIDKTPRLKAARTAMVIQNSSVILCAVVVYFVITFKSTLQSLWPNETLLYLCYALIILIAIVSTLGSMGTNIAVQKDWIVVICAAMTATLQRIYLTSKLVAPIATGQIMYFASVGIGALCIAGWNLISVFIEYFLLWKVYSLIPELKDKKYKNNKNKDKEEVAEEMITLNTTVPQELELELKVPLEDPSDNKVSVDDSYIRPEIPNTAEVNNAAEEKPKEGKETESCVRKMFSGILILYRGWRIYIKYDVAFAGLGLAFLYMTVLGFDNITVGFAYTQGVNEFLMGILMAAGSVIGILGTIFYPIFRRHLGLERTGLFGFFFEISFLCLCLASVWVPGSPFDPFFKKENKKCFSVYNTATAGNDSMSWSGSNDNNISHVPYNVSQSIDGLFSNDTNIGTSIGKPDWHCYISIGLLLSGIIGARFGLWMADLTISQLFLENIKETERGIVSGVQHSLNTLMDMLKFLLVIVAPQPEVFGFLVFISFLFIFMGWMLFMKYSYGTRGHLFHFDKILKCQCKSERNDKIVTDMDT